MKGIQLRENHPISLYFLTYKGFGTSVGYHPTVGTVHSTVGTVHPTVGTKLCGQLMYQSPSGGKILFSFSRETKS